MHKMNKFFYIVPYWRAGSLTLCGANFDRRVRSCRGESRNRFASARSQYSGSSKSVASLLEGLAKLEVILMLVDATTLRADDQLGSLPPEAQQFQSQGIVEE